MIRIDRNEVFKLRNDVTQLLGKLRIVEENNRELNKDIDIIAKERDEMIAVHNQYKTHWESVQSEYRRQVQELGENIAKLSERIQNYTSQKGLNADEECKETLIDLLQYCLDSSQMTMGEVENCLKHMFEEEMIISHATYEYLKTTLGVKV